MLVNTPFYYNTLRNTTIAFGNLFNEIYIDQNGTTIKIPLQYLSKEKFVLRSNAEPDLHSQKVAVQNTLPAMGFEMNSIGYAADRKLNKMYKIHDEVNSLYNRVSYDVGFSLYIGTRKIDESFRIVEQILPYFTPELIVKIKDKDDMGVSSNVPFVLEATDFEIIADGDFEERRSVLWTLSFAAKIYLYPDMKTSSIIKKTVVTISDLDTEYPLEQVIMEVDPPEAEEGDEWEYKETINGPGDIYDPDNP